MIDIRFDMRSFEDMVTALDRAARDQLPFALSVMLNEAAKVTRLYLVDTVWPAHVQVRNTRFLGTAMRVKWASKGDLSVEIFDRLGRAHLKLHAEGGTKQARGMFAIPQPGVIKRGSRGVPASQKPSNLPRSYRQGNRIVQKETKRKGGRARTAYALSAIVRQPKDVPFYEEFGTRFILECQRLFPITFAKAMATARPGRR